MIKIPSKVKYLSYAGIIPIIMGVIGSFDLSLMGNNINSFLVELGMLFSTVILSFLGGCLFVFEIHSKSEINFKGLMMSMCPPIWAVFSLLLPCNVYFHPWKSTLLFLYFRGRQKYIRPGTKNG